MLFSLTELRTSAVLDFACNLHLSDPAMIQGTSQGEDFEVSPSNFTPSRNVKENSANQSGNTSFQIQVQFCYSQISNSRRNQVSHWHPSIQASTDEAS